MAKIIIVTSLLIAVAIGIVTNLASDSLSKHAKKNKKKVWWILGGLVALSIIVALIPTDEGKGLYSDIAKTYIPNERDLPTGFRVSVADTTAEFPIKSCGGDSYQIIYVNTNSASPDGKVLLFRTAVCPNEKSASELANSNFDAQWPQRFMESMAAGSGLTNFTWQVDAPVFEFNLNNVDEKFLVRTHVVETNSKQNIGAMATVVLRLKNVVSVVTVFVQDADDSANQAIYYASLAVEKLQGTE